MSGEVSGESAGRERRAEEGRGSVWQVRGGVCSKCRGGVRAPVEEDVAAALDGVQPAHAGANQDSEALRVEVLPAAIL